MYVSHNSGEKTSRHYLGSHLNVEMMYSLYIDGYKERNTTEALIAMPWFYRYIFNAEFNIGFHLSQIDTCDTCDHYKVKLTEINLTNGEKQTLEEKYQRHVSDYKQRYNMKREDTNKPKLNNSQ